MLKNIIIAFLTVLATLFVQQKAKEVMHPFLIATTPAPSSSQQSVVAQPVALQIPDSLPTLPSLPSGLISVGLFTAAAGCVFKGIGKFAVACSEKEFKPELYAAAWPWGVASAGTVGAYVCWLCQ